MNLYPCLSAGIGTPPKLWWSARVCSTVAGRTLDTSRGRGLRVGGLRLAETPTRYPHLLRTGSARWWHPVAGAALVVVAWTIPSGVLSDLFAALGGADVDRLDPALDVVAAGLSTALGTPAAVAAVVLVHHLPAGVLLSATGRVEAGLFVVGAVVATLAYVPMLVNRREADTDGGEVVGWVGLQTFLRLLLAIGVAIPPAAAAEEIVYRGYLTQSIATWTHRAWPPAVATSLMFAAAHGAQNAWMFADRFFFGLALCWLTWRTGGLEAAIAVHTVYNVLVGVAAAATGQVGSELRASRSDARRAVASMAGTALTVLAVTWWAQRHRIAR